MIDQAFAADLRHVVQFLAQHLGHQLHPGEILDLILSHQFAVPQYRDLVTYLVHLIQEMGYKDNAHSPGPQIPHQAEQFGHFLLIQRGGGLIQNQYLAVHIHCPGDGHHLLYGNGTA